MKMKHLRLVVAGVIAAGALYNDGSAEAAEKRIQPWAGIAQPPSEMNCWAISGSRLTLASACTSAAHTFLTPMMVDGTSAGLTGVVTSLGCTNNNLGSVCAFPQTSNQNGTFFSAGVSQCVSSNTTTNVSHANISLPANGTEFMLVTITPNQGLTGCGINSLKWVGG